MTPAVVNLAVKFTPTMPLAPMNWVGGHPIDGAITAVHNPEGTLVSLNVIDLDGRTFQVIGANYLQPGDPVPAAGNYCVPA